MKLGKVIGKIISTRKEGNITGLRLVAVRYLDENLNDTAKTAACIDSVNSGEDDIVILCSSSSARLTKTTANSAVDNTIVGIVDSISSGKKYKYKK